MQEKGTVNISARHDPAQGNEVVKTRSGHVIKQPDTHIHINTIKSLAGMLASTKKLYG